MAQNHKKNLHNAGKLLKIPCNFIFGCQNQRYIIRKQIIYILKVMKLYFFSFIWPFWKGTYLSKYQLHAILLNYGYLKGAPVCQTCHAIYTICIFECQMDLVVT